MMKEWEIMDYYSHRTAEEKEKFIAIGEEVSALLDEAMKYLKRAKRWNILDLGHGGMFSTAMKQKNMQVAGQLVSVAVSTMENYGKEYKSVAYGLGTTALDTSGILGVGDYFYHDEYIDLVTYERIKGMMDIIENAKNKIAELAINIQCGE